MKFTIFILTILAPFVAAYLTSPLTFKERWAPVELIEGGMKGDKLTPRRLPAPEFNQHVRLA